ncbi:transcription termination factor Rho [Bradymonas sediminis]|nr:transcription termination factor Rho [Bradymonas sediminis]
MARRRKRRRGSKQPKVNKLKRLTERLADYTPIQPAERIKLETGPKDITGRLIDLIAPIGKGQRVLVTSPPKAGKTTILQTISRAVHKNHPEIYQVALLIDERPEEATDFRRNIPAKVEASTTDSTPEQHVRLAEKVFADALEKLLDGEDVLILLDSITRLARAYNTTNRSGNGRTLSGGITAGALDRPRQLFGAARNLEEAGSLTIVATALIDTGSRMDDVIFHEFKGTGNSELVLDRELANRRLFPAVDLAASGTRRELDLMSPVEGKRVPDLRRRLADMSQQESLSWFLKRIKRTQNNLELLGSF